MRKNRRIPKRMNVLTRTTARFGAVLVVLFAMVIMNILATSSCQQISMSIGRGERELASLEDACNREATRWQQMTAPEKIDSALLRHGLAMKPPRPDQNVYMKSDGKPYRGQPSVAAVGRRNGGKTATYRARRR